MINLTFKEKLLLHQSHPAKLAVDISGSIISTYFFWEHRWLTGLFITFSASIAITLYLFHYADWEKLSRSPLGLYTLRFMNRSLEGIRFGGQVLIWVGAWNKNPFGIIAGAIVILGAWLWGIRKN
ncbi:hypothetical protein [Leptospira stimsonii]|uniref:Uncharacterized protein n=1 Tax=Leptospira stimsonii TaxID=2202203 RepID=A0A4R9L5I2_9LEPT|nr:hypothetical protein [Leptospira stimsonii]RHX83357.1 hypothetical protein DLM78_21895 [Leptospira stimsonii]TGK23243.1 hypothetical protein EHO98_05645 [Leptospira stimsonii]TGM18766.1 hypothetical protein EHQ90_06470 [Leptospira stimsonii]